MIEIFRQFFRFLFMVFEDFIQYKAFYLFQLSIIYNFLYFINVLCLETPQMSLHYLEKLVVDLACAQKKSILLVKPSQVFTFLHYNMRRKERILVLRM